MLNYAAHYNMMVKISVFLVLLVLFLVLSVPGLALETSPEENATENQSVSTLPLISGTDYLVQSVKVPIYESTANKGDILHPSLIVKNTGYNDTTKNHINVSAYLGNYPLLPVTSTFPALMAGQERQVFLAYKIPGTIGYGGYVLSVIVDPDNLTHDTNTSNNMKKAGGIITINSPDDDTFIGCEACWAGYR